MKLITIKELSEILKISYTTIYRLCERGMPHMRIGLQYRFDLEEIMKYWKQKNGNKNQ